VFFLSCACSLPDLTINNSCAFGLWIEGRAAGGVPIPGHSNPITYVAPGKTISFTVPDAGLASTRFWAKYGCDSNGANCLIGDQMANTNLYPITGCPPTGCTAPVDSLFEATWGCKSGGAACSGSNLLTWFDTSQVDGYTLPYRLLLTGNTQCDCNAAGCTNLKLIDATKLGLSSCPSTEDMSTHGSFPTYNKVDLRVIKNNEVIACASPCKRFTNALIQGGFGIFEGSLEAEYFCCPTPNPTSCLASAGCITPAACRTGPVATSKYVTNVHHNTNGLNYAYSYDDNVGLHTCPATGVYYTMEFCPPGSPAYPISAS